VDRCRAAVRSLHRGYAIDVIRVAVTEQDAIAAQAIALEERQHPHGLESGIEDDAGIAVSAADHVAVLVI